MRDNVAYYQGVNKEYITFHIRNHFKLPRNGKVKITIKKKGPYQFVLSRFNSKYQVYKNSKPIGIVCCNPFKQLFFKPERRKTYDIIVERPEK